MVEKEKLIKNDSNKKKEQKSSSKLGIFTYIVGAYGALVTGILVALLVSKYEPESFSIPPPPKFEGPLALNKKLQGAELLLKDQVKGPESLIVEGDTIYVAPEDGRILKVVNGKIVKEVILVDDKVCQTSEGRFKNLEKCGRPLGMRRLNKDLIIFADAYLGIVTVDVEKGKTNVVLPGDAVVDGVQMKFADDLDVLDENTVIFSDASTKYQYKTCVYGYLESKPDGRIIQLNIKTKEAKVLLEGLYFPNGVQLFPDKQSFLVSETHRDRLKRFYISGPKKGQQEIFVNNLPGAPDNVRLNSRGNFYVAIAYTRHPDKFFLWDFLGPYPWVRNLILQLIPDSYLTAFQLSFIHKHGLVVEIDKNGKYISSLHDPTGVVKFLSEVHETDKYIYVASFNQPHIARRTILFTVTDHFKNMGLDWWPSFPFRCLYFGYAVSCLGNRLWSFAIIFVLEYLGGLRLVTINQLFQGVSGMLMSAYVGNWLDRHDRHFGAQAMLALNNLTVAISAALLAVCLSLNSNSGALYLICLCSSVLFFSVSNAGSLGEKIAFTKDWVVVLANRDKKAVLSTQNSILTMIDQLSAVLAPLIAGFILSYTSYRTGCIIFVGWNAFDWLLEAILLRSVYRAVPELATRIRTTNTTYETFVQPSTTPCQMIKVYLRQKVFPVAVAMALLYLTVLAFDGISVSYGKTEGLTESVLGAFQSTGSAMGFIGAVSYTVIERKFGVRKVGFIGLLIELSCLMLALASIWLPGSPFDPITYFKDTTFSSWWHTFLDTFSVKSGAKDNVSNSGVDWSDFTVAGRSAASLFSLYIGMALSRYGLWVADLAITQIMQESVPETERGTVFGVENSLCMCFSVGKDLLAIMLPDPKTFGLLILISFGTVLCGFLQYIYYCLKSRIVVKEEKASNNEPKESSQNASLCEISF